MLKWIADCVPSPAQSLPGIAHRCSMPFRRRAVPACLRRCMHPFSPRRRGTRAGNKKSLRMESDDITVGLDNMRYKGYGDADDDVDFM